MKFGYCINMIARQSDGIGLENLPMLKEAGVDYVEMPLAQMMALSDDAFVAGPLQALQDNDLICLACNNFFPASIHLTGDHVDQDEILSYAQKALKRAAMLGAKRVVFGSSGARNVPNGFSIAKGISQLAEILPLLGDIAAQNGITLVIEPLNAAESNLVHRFTHGLSLAGRSKHPQVAALADYYHMVLTGDTPDELLYAGDRLKHLHIANPLGRSLPLPHDGVPYEQLFRALREISYDATMSIEAYMRADQGLQEIKESLHYLRGLQA